MQSLPSSPTRFSTVEFSTVELQLWEPPHRFVMVWQVNAQWKPDLAMKSEVDVRFSADGPEATDVELVHHKFETIGAEAGASMRKDVDGGWPGLMQRFAEEAERSRPQCLRIISAQTLCVCREGVRLSRSCTG